MQIDKFFLLKVWVISTLLIAFVCACFPNFRTLPLIYNHPSLAFRVGLFVGVLEMVLTFSVPIFLCLYGIFYLLAVRFYLSDVLVKSALIVLFLIGVFISNSIYFKWHWFHPFFFAYTAGTALAIYILYIYNIDPEYLD